MLITAKNRYGWRASEVVVFIIFTIGAAALVWAGLNGYFDLTGAIVFAILALIAGWGGTIAAFRRKTGSALTAQMNPETFEARFFMKRPNKAIWGNKLDVMTNSAKITEATKITLLEIKTTPASKVFVFHTPKRALYLPLR
jgi:hypothetical protein